MNQELFALHSEFSIQKLTKTGRIQWAEHIISIMDNKLDACHRSSRHKNTWIELVIVKQKMWFIWSMARTAWSALFHIHQYERKRMCIFLVYSSFCTQSNRVRFVQSYTEWPDNSRKDSGFDQCDLRGYLNSLNPLSTQPTMGPEPSEHEHVERKLSHLFIST